MRIILFLSNCWIAAVLRKLPDCLNLKIQILVSAAHSHNYIESVKDLFHPARTVGTWRLAHAAPESLCADGNPSYASTGLLLADVRSKTEREYKNVQFCWQALPCSAQVVTLSRRICCEI